jgi:pullulanase/glycogen debranching enzyme
MEKKIIQIIVFISMIFPISNMLGEDMFHSRNKTDELSHGGHSKIDLDSYYSEKKLGSFVEDGKTIFRLFTPNAKSVNLITFESPENETGKKYEMERDSDGVWEVILEGELYGIYYGYNVIHSEESLKGEDVLCLDPYAKAVTTFNTYKNPRKAIVWEDNFDWEGDQWIQRDWRDLIIYEMHIRDMTKHESSDADLPGTYLGLIEKGKRGGIDYIKSLGINTVELLPAQEFGNIEIPFEDSLSGKFNTWNPYERNHWGYMTAAFFAPEAYYSENWSKLKWNEWMGKSGKQVNDFKQMVKAFHKEGIAVIMDVVYNHLSEYEVGNLKQIDKEYYFRLDKKGNFIAQSFCGNDLKTERPMMRRMIVESILYWMTEYHIDGFRFDLGKLIDWETIEEIIHEAKKINPNVVFVCEPWGGGYDPNGFSQRGWGAWNDQIRNGIKGENPFNGLGWIFGKWYGNNNSDRIKSYVNGTLTIDESGLFEKKEHSVNYLASHDGYTLGDFIRIAEGSVKSDEVTMDLNTHVKLTPLQLKYNKLAAMF